MGAVIALLNKHEEDVTKAASTMLSALSIRKTEAYGVASPSIVRHEKSVEKLLSQNLYSSVAIGHASVKILPQDREQPVQIGKTSLVFEGRIFDPQRLRLNRSKCALKTSEMTLEGFKRLIKQAEGDFVFVTMNSDELVAGRDVLGARPLYYGENAILAGLASERKALWKIGIRHVKTFPPGMTAKVNRQGFKFSVTRRIINSRPRNLTMGSASEKLEQLLRKAVNDRIAGLESVAVAFSGGLDSSIIASLSQKSKVNVHLIHVSLADHSETEHAKKVADELKLPLHSYLYSEKDVFETLPCVLDLIEEFDPVKTSIGIPFYWIAEKASQLKLKVILAGQGADELFAGYRRYVDNYVSEGRDEVRHSLHHDVVNMYKSNLERDFKICNFHGLELRLPFVTNKLVRFALSLPVELKLQPTDNTLRKLVLRNVGRNLGLPRSVVDRPKKAIQYATGVSKVLGRTAKREDLTVKEYLRRVYQTIFPKEDVT
jgi:asparagine synthase (glutamine-hydrolysing)